MGWPEELAREIAGEVLTQDQQLTEAAGDFGRIVTRRPQAVVRPASTQEVSRIVQFAGRHSLSISARGSGHSQAGQSLSDGIPLDLRTLNQVIDIKGDAIEVQAGATWRSIVERLAPLQLSPPSLPITST